MTGDLPTLANDNSVLAPAKTEQSPAGLRRKSNSEDLLYVSGYQSHDVEVYTWPGGRHVRELRELDDPLGECVDSVGNVFVTNRLRSRVKKFAHGGTKPIGELRHDPNQAMQDCSIDPTTGDLAVANQYGSVAIYANAQGKPDIYQVPTLAELHYIGYDQTGDLFVHGSPRGVGGSQIAELAKGSTGFEPVALNGATLSIPGRIQYAHRTLNVGDSQSPGGYAIIYQVAVSDYAATVTGMTKLSSTQYAAEFWIQGKILTVADEQTKVIQLYHYPDGGLPFKVRYSRGRGVPIGVVVSKAP